MGASEGIGTKIPGGFSGKGSKKEAPRSLFFSVLPAINAMMRGMYAPAAFSGKSGSESCEGKFSRTERAEISFVAEGGIFS